MLVLSNKYRETSKLWTLDLIQSEIDKTPNAKYEISPEEFNYFYTLLEKIQDDFLKRFERSGGMFLKLNAAVLQGMLQYRIPFNITFGEICNYPLFFD